MNNISMISVLHKIPVKINQIGAKVHRKETKKTIMLHPAAIDKNHWGRLTIFLLEIN